MNKIFPSWSNMNELELLFERREENVFFLFYPKKYWNVLVILSQKNSQNWLSWLVVVKLK